MEIGILALQGAFVEHEKILRHLGEAVVEVRLPEHLAGLDGLIIPGGESTTIGKVARRWGLLEPLRAFARSGCPIWGTCAGMILMAKEVVDGMGDQPLLALMDVAVRRNAFGRQVDSFEADLQVPVVGEQLFHAIFIRAPFIERVGEGVEVLARLEPTLSNLPGAHRGEVEGDGTIVAVRQGNLMATAFHPELTDDDRFHRYFLSLRSSRQRA